MLHKLEKYRKICGKILHQYGKNITKSVDMNENMLYNKEWIFLDKENMFGMYSYIKGILVQKSADFVVVEAGGIGYLINMPLTLIEKAGAVNDKVKIYTYLNVREDAMELFGFNSMEEREMFLNLTSVSGVGPKVAMAILSVMTPPKFALAVITNDAKMITKAKGVGPKAAQRIILELKDKLKDEDLEITGDDFDENPIALGDNLSEAVSALVVLGYRADEAKNAVKGIDMSLSVEEIIKKALINLMR